NRVKRETGSNFSANLSAEFANNQIVNSTYIASQDTLIAPGVLLGAGGQFIRPENIDGYYRIRVNTVYGTPIKPGKINLNLSTNVHHEHDIGLLNNTKTY